MPKPAPKRSTALKRSTAERPAARPDPAQHTVTSGTRSWPSGACAPDPRQPHERDESSDSQSVHSGESADTMRQAHEDVTRGLVDTDTRSQQAAALMPRLQGKNTRSRR